MDKREIENLLNKVANKNLSIDEALLQLKKEPFVQESFSDLGYAKVDNHRSIRQGAAEVIYGAGKTPEQIKGICETMLTKGQKTILITRIPEETYRFLDTSIPTTYYPVAQVGIVGEVPEPTGNGTVVVACAGTSDLPVAEEAALTAEVLGNCVTRLYDVGVSGIHRLLAHVDDIMTAQVVVAVAGMEGASCECCWWHGFLSSYRGAYQCGIRCLIWWCCRFARNAEFMCEWGKRGQY